MPGRTVYHNQPTSPYAGYSSPATVQYPSSPLAYDVTPPPLQHTRSLYASTPLPAFSASINPVLSEETGAGLGFNVAVDPATVPLNVSSTVLSQPAATSANPSGLPCLLIHVPGLASYIQVVRPKHKGYVTVGDVLSQVYADLQRPLQPRDLQSHLTADDIEGARRWRCAYLTPHDLSAYPRRVDALLGATRFCGLVPTSESAEVLVLSVR